MIDIRIRARHRCGIATIGRFAGTLTVLVGTISCQVANPFWCPELPHHDCRAGCTHVRCLESNACLPDGTCAAAADVAYVRASATGMACTREDPCGTLGQAIATSRPYVKVSAMGMGTGMGIVFEPNPVAIARNLTILADTGAEIAASRTGNLLRLDGGTVDIYDLGFTGVQGASGPEPDAAIFVGGGDAVVRLTRVTIHDNLGEGASMSAGATRGALTLVDSTITRNDDGIVAQGTTTGGRKTITVMGCKLLNNNTGVDIDDSSDVTLQLTRTTISGNREGIYVNAGTFAIVGNVINNNGTMEGEVGGVRIEAPFASTNRLEFNTIVGNQVGDGIGSGIHCNPATFTARNNLLFQNATSLNSKQIGGSCHHSYSFLPVDSAGVSGENNVIGSMNPMFRDQANSDFRLLPGSPALGKGDPAFISDNLSQPDFDNDLRQIPPDIGADEAP